MAEDPPASKPPGRLAVILAVPYGAAVAGFFIYQATKAFSLPESWSLYGTLLGAVTVAVFLSIFYSYNYSEITAEATARERVRLAEVVLADALRPEAARPILDEGATAPIPGSGDTTQRTETTERPDDRLALAALWTVTHERLDLYHRIATGQARRSFVAAQIAMLVGFILLIIFATLAARARTPTAAITTGGLGAVAAGFAGYIGRTFIRSQESAASHLRAYFDQPLEFSRYLAAERLLAASGDLNSDQRASILSSLVQAIVKPVTK